MKKLAIILFCFFLLAGCAPSLTTYQRLPNDYENQLNIKHYDVLFSPGSSASEHMKDLLKQKLAAKMPGASKGNSNKLVSVSIDINSIEIANKLRASLQGVGNAKNYMDGSVTILDFEKKDILGKYGLRAERNYGGYSFLFDLEERIAEEFATQVVNLLNKN